MGEAASELCLLCVSCRGHKGLHAELLKLHYVTGTLGEATLCERSVVGAVTKTHRAVSSTHTHLPQTGDSEFSVKGPPQLLCLTQSSHLRDVAGNIMSIWLKPTESF